jgi:hypothetical protein
MPLLQLLLQFVQVELSGTQRHVNFCSVTDVSERLSASVFSCYPEISYSNSLRSTNNELPINTTYNLGRFWLSPIIFSKPRTPPNLGQLSRLVRNASIYGISKYKTRRSEVNKCQTTNTPTPDVRNGLLKADVQVVQESHKITTLLRPYSTLQFE